jgi:alpha-L-arabinofuranosidase
MNPLLSAVKDLDLHPALLQIVNVADVQEVITFVFPAAVSSGTQFVLKGAATDSNTPATPGLVVPVTTSIGLPASRNFVYTAPPYSVTVIRIL